MTELLVVHTDVCDLCHTRCIQSVLAKHTPMLGAIWAPAPSTLTIESAIWAPAPSTLTIEHMRLSFSRRLCVGP